MKQVIIILTFFFVYANCFAANKEKELKNLVFVFNNAFFKRENPVRSFDQRVALLKQLGFDGIEHRETEDIFEMKAVMEKKGLKLFTDYVKIDVDKEQPYLPEWKQVIPKLKGTEMILWAHLHSEKYKPSDEAADEVVVPILQELADIAKLYGVRIAIYPHVNFLAEKVEDSYRLAQKADRENVGSVFNLCHFLKTDSEENLEKVIDLTLPKLFAVSISGADGGDTQNMGWNQLIRPLGEGSFDVYRVVELLADKGYKGPIGIQCYSIPGEPEEFLTKSSKAWKTFKKKYSRPVNSLTSEEKKEGWELLFNGHSTEKWRGINKQTFPASGWKVENGALITNAAGGHESASGGDIITKKEYGDFILKWEWKMETKGGNSGIKYFVKEGPEVSGVNNQYGYGLEYQILDDKNHSWMLKGKMKPNDYHTVGSLYEIYPASADKRPNPLGLWNESKIVCQNGHVEHWLNGKKILEYDRGSEDFRSKIAQSKFKDVENFGLHEKGHLLIQDHGSLVHFRNIKIKEL